MTNAFWTLTPTALDVHHDIPRSYLINAFISCKLVRVQIKLVVDVQVFTPNVLSVCAFVIEVCLGLDPNARLENVLLVEIRLRKEEFQQLVIWFVLEAQGLNVGEGSPQAVW